MNDDALVSGTRSKWTARVVAHVYNTSWAEGGFGYGLDSDRLHKIQLRIIDLTNCFSFGIQYIDLT